MRSYRGRSRRSYKSKKPTVKKAIRKAVKTVQDARIKAVVKKVLGRQVEVKSVTTNATAVPYSKQASSVNYYDNNVILITPNSTRGAIVQGTGAADRIGNEIRVKKAFMDLVLYPKPYSATINTNPSPLMVTFWCVTPREGFVAPIDMIDLFQNQLFQTNNSYTGYQSNITDIIRPVNEDRLIVHWKRTYKLGHSTMYASPNAATGTGNNSGPYNAQWANNDYKMNHKLHFDFTKHISKTIKYNDNGTLPEAKTLYLLISIARADGTSIVSTDLPCDIYYQHNIQFTDM